MIADAYPLSPIQNGMLFHHLRAARSGVDVEQIVITYPEAPDWDRLRRAWELAVAEQPVLRTAFSWDGTEEPSQQVHDAVTVPWERILTETGGGFEQYLHEDRARGFDLAQPPLMR